jgi:DNA-binding NtrC family response regulator
MKILLVESDVSALQGLERALSDLELQISSAAVSQTGLELFALERHGIVLLDLDSSTQTLETLRAMLALDPGTEIIVASRDTSAEFAMTAIREGACAVEIGELNPGKIVDVVKRLLTVAQERKRVTDLDKQMLEASQFEGMVSRSPVMWEVFSHVRRIAPHFQTVLITGETGTGKELVARALHNLSTTAAQPFAVCNCSALVESLLETELFGYVKGAFTGAVQDKQGVFEYAADGVVFLDEIGELPMAAQAKLLRVLHNHEVQRVGSPTVRRVNARVVGATHRDLRKMVKEGQFREDLFYRLATLEILLPRLGDRKEDLLLLIRHFVSIFAKKLNRPIAGVTRRTQALLLAHSWPGNVRELENVLSNACMMAERNVIDLQDLPAYLRQPAEVDERNESLTLEAMQHKYLLQVLQQVSGNKVRAAEILGISRGTIYEMLARAKSRQVEPTTVAKAPSSEMRLGASKSLR